MYSREGSTVCGGLVSVGERFVNKLKSVCKFSEKRLRKLRVHERLWREVCVWRAEFLDFGSSISSSWLPLHYAGEKV